MPEKKTIGVRTPFWVLIATLVALVGFYFMLPVVGVPQDLLVDGDLAYLAMG